METKEGDNRRRWVTIDFARVMR